MTSSLPTRDSLQPMRDFFASGATQSYAFRLKQLRALEASVRKHEDAIARALYADLRKSPEEAFAAETGLVLASIRQAIRELRKWMRPQRVKTDLVNFASSSRIYRDARGVVLIISPWNYPFQLLLIPLVGAIAGGNAALLKPSEFAPATASIMETIIRETFPPEYIQILQGEGGIVVPAAMRDFRFDHVFYTGSAPVGKAIYQMAAADLIPVTLELGGKSPAIVEADADLKVAARRIALGKFLNAGQTCIAPDYLLVHESIYQPFLEQLRQTLRDFYGEDPGQSYSYGRVINEKRFEKLVGYLTNGKIFAGGRSDRETRYLEPTLLEDVPPDAPLMQEEIFGPILPVVRFSTEAEALALISRHPHPLAFYVFSAKGRHWMEKVSFGGGCINNASLHFTNPHLPFGGVGNSGIGAYHGRYTFDVFTHAKSVLKTPVWFDPWIKYPPFQGKMKWIKRFIR